jgi:type VI secretion system secreted protein VgrG
VDRATQDRRLISISTPLGKDFVLLRNFQFQENVSALFRIDADLLREEDSSSTVPGPMPDLIGKNVTITLQLADGSLKFLNGFVAQLVQGLRNERFTAYHAVIVPWFWFLTRKTDCRIFQELSVPEIVEKVYRDGGFLDFRDELTKTYTKWDYCVQYRETDFNFVSRLLEAEGIFYFFVHENGKHTLVLGDASSEAGFFSSKRKLSFLVQTQLDDDVATSWQTQKELRSGSSTLRDFHFETPNRVIQSSAPSVFKSPMSDPLEIYDFPGGFAKKFSKPSERLGQIGTEGNKVTERGMEADEWLRELHFGASLSKVLGAGLSFDLTEHSSEINGPYRILSIQHSVTQTPDYVSEMELNGTYSNSFCCLPLAVPFRPQRSTQKPVIHGSQTAIVVGPPGEEISTDKFGRVKVQFHWDRKGKSDDKSSCFVRVGSPWAGNQWGAIHIPRIGQEVIVSFLEGDPDQPIIIGSVYNAKNMPPYPLPAEQTKSTIKSDSSKGGGGFNEIRFEDKKGKEQVFIHAERNQDNRVKKESLEWVGANRHLIVGGDQLELVNGDKHLTAKGDQNEKVYGTLSQDIEMDLQQKIGMKHALDAGMEIHLKAGMNVVIEAGVTLTLKVGGNFVNINPGGVFIQGTMVMINSGGFAGTGSGASPGTAKKPAEADNAKPGEKATVAAPAASTPAKLTLTPTKASPQATALKEAAKTGVPFCEKCEAARRARESGQAQ